jgi:hypothetical protein
MVKLWQFADRENHGENIDNNRLFGDLELFKITKKPVVVSFFFNNDFIPASGCLLYYVIQMLR